MLLQLSPPLCFRFPYLSSEALMSVPGKSPLVNGTTTSLHRSERGRDSVHVLKQLKCLGSVASLEVKGEIDFLLVAPPPPPLPCYLHSQMSALMSIVGTSRGLLALRQVLVLVSGRRVPHSWGQRNGSLHIPTPRAEVAPLSLSLGVLAEGLCCSWVRRVSGAGSLLPFQACPKGCLPSGL